MSALDKAMYAKNSFTWREFVLDVAERHRRGETDEQISLALGNNEFTWRGKAKRIYLNNTHTAGIEFQMPEVAAISGAGKYIKASYLFVNVTEKDKTLWAKVTEGSNVTFTVSIPTIEYGFLLGIRVGIDDTDNEAILLIGTMNGKPTAQLSD